MIDFDLESELSRLSRAWIAERDAERVEARIALRGLTLDEALPAPGERRRLGARSRGPGGHLRARPGRPRRGGLGAARE